MNEEMKKFAHEFGADLARAQLAKQAERYEETVDEHTPILSRIGQHAGTGLKWGGGLGALLGAALGLGAGRVPHGGRHGTWYGTRALTGSAGALGGAALGGLTGGLLGAGAGATQGSYDAGLVHALKRRENPSFDDNPTARAAATGLFLGPNPVMNAAASEFGKSRGHSEPDLASALAALRGARRDEAL